MDKGKIASAWQDVIVHKRLVLESCAKMKRYFESIGETEKAAEIYYRGIVHDNSKMNIEEIVQLAKIDDNHQSMRHAGCQLPEEMRAYLQLHYQHNTHHPEHWDDVSMMPEMDIVEMCCDWHARSCQFKTDLLEFARVRQKTRFHFPPETFEKILKICEVLVS